MKTNGDYVLTPQGLVHKSRVHQAKSEDEAGTPEPAPNRFTPSNSVMRALSPNGWKASATFAAYLPLGKMSVKFKVPEAPSVGGAVIFLFPGAQNAQMRTILQPVLQWGNNGEFGGEYWTIACWHVSTKAHWYHSTPETVNTGDVVTGTVEVVEVVQGPDDEKCCTWQIEASTESGVRTRHKVNNVPSLMLFLVGAALEAYPEDPCCTAITRDQYPASSTIFFDIELTDLAGYQFIVDWSARCDMGDNSLCGCNNTVQISPDKNTITLKY